MPPVFGPVSPSPTRLKSCAGSNGTAVTPSHTANSETSGPARYCSTSTGCPDARTATAWAWASARSLVTTTPLPAAKPSSLTTYGAPQRVRAPSISASEVTPTASAVGTPAAAITSLANAFEPSIRAAAAPGPKTAKPLERSASAAPLTSGTSGPITTRSGEIDAASSAMAAGSVASTGWDVAREDVPALPGPMCRSSTPGSRRNARSRACSRAPEPITRMRTSGA